MVPVSDFGEDCRFKKLKLRVLYAFVGNIKPLLLLSLWIAVVFSYIDPAYAFWKVYGKLPSNASDGQ